MNTKTLHRVLAGLAFAISFFMLAKTAQPTVPFWDCGEFSAAAVWQQVGHPPGAPLFLMAAKIFHLLPFGEQGWRINLISVTSSAFTVMFVYLIGVQLIRNYRKESLEDMGSKIAVFGSAFVGALALAFSDTFWFNGVESEVYAAAVLFVALIVWLLLRWHEEANNEGNERYLLLIAYLIGLSTGVQLFAILCSFTIAVVIYFRRYKLTFWGLVLALVLGTVGLFTVYKGILTTLPTWLSGNMFKTEAKEYALTDSLFPQLVVVLIVGAAIYGLYVGAKKGRPILEMLCVSFLLILVGYSSYTHILLRSNAEPPMNENEPKNFTQLVRYISREQYGEAPAGFPRRHQTEGYFVENYQKVDENGDFVYGEWEEPETRYVERSDGTQIGIPDFSGKINYAGDFKYMWKWQMTHMYWRYFAWNFIGRTSDVQDAEAFGNFPFWNTTKKLADAWNIDSGYKDIFPISFYALPFLLGLIGLVYHFLTDWRMALAFLLMFLVMGVMAALQQNQQNPQPRERDYFYVGSFLVWALWIGYGCFAIIDTIRKSKEKGSIINPAIAGGVVAFCLLIAPLNMLKGGYRLHSRWGNYIPFDYSYNILQSLEKDAVLFTNGDNDTFPLWYLQDVEGIRRDVRVVNLSLGNTTWYVRQLKHRSPWGAKKLPLSFADETLIDDENDKKALSYSVGDASVETIPVRDDIMRKFTTDPLMIGKPMTYTLQGQQYGQPRDGKQTWITRVQDKLIADILRNTKFERPVYFSITVGPDAFAGLSDYFRYEGMAMRICPVKQNDNSPDGQSMDEEFTRKCLMNSLNDERFFTGPRAGFKFRNLSNRDVFYDEVHRRLIQNYRSIFFRYSTRQLEMHQNKAEAIKIIDEMNLMISPDQFPMGYDLEQRVSEFYKKAGAEKQALVWAQRAYTSAMVFINNEHLKKQIDPQRRQMPEAVAADALEAMGRYDEEKSILMTLKQEAPNDPSLDLRIAQVDFMKLEKAGKLKEALDLTESLLDKFSPMNSPQLGASLYNLQQRADSLRKQLGLPARSTPAPQPLPLSPR